MLNAGNAGCSSGLSKRIFDAWTADTPNNGFSGVLTPAQTLTIKSLCFSVAKAVVDEITANASVSTPLVQPGASTVLGTIT